MVAIRPTTLLRIDRYFDWRGKDISRLEGFSDAAFALMLTLLVVSSVVPDTLDKLFELVGDFPAFALTFAVVVWFWVEHYLFFRRYGLRDGYSIFLNGILLLLVLFYVYPLKFLTGALMQTVFGIGTGIAMGGAGIDGQDLMLFYSGGYCAIFLVFALLYAHAWRQRERLELNGAEEALTRGGLRSSLLHVAIGATSICLALLLSGGLQALSGMIYFMIGPVMFVNGLVQGRGVAKAMASSE